MSALAAVHWLGPTWLGAVWMVPGAAWRWRVRDGDALWRRHVDAALLPHLLERGSRKTHVWRPVTAALVFSLGILALAGPSWRQVSQPALSSRAPLVLAVDLSSAALASDVPPSRLAQARAKLADLLARRGDGQVALVAYADDAYTVAPLTDDAGNLALYLDALSPDVMPLDGERADRAITWSRELMRRAGFDNGDILLLTGQAGMEAAGAARDAAAQGYTVSVLDLAGAQAVTYRTSAGELRRTAPDASTLRRIAQAGDGRYARLRADDGDLRALGVLTPRVSGERARGGATSTWQDQGYWLLLPLMALMLLGFRRQGAFAAVLFVGLLPLQRVDAAELWRRADQIESARMREAADAYRRGDFDVAAKAYAAVHGADAQYNRGNALAKSGALQDALSAYDAALRLQPGMPDAVANRRAVEAALKRRPPGGGQQGQQGGKQPKPGQQGSPGQGGQPRPASSPQGATSTPPPSSP